MGPSELGGEGGNLGRGTKHGFPAPSQQLSLVLGLHHLRPPGGSKGLDMGKVHGSGFMTSWLKFQELLAWVPFMSQSVCALSKPSFKRAYMSQSLISGFNFKPLQRQNGTTHEAPSYSGK